MRRGLLISSVLLAACASPPSPRYQISPLGQETFWKAGAQASVEQGKKLRIEAAFTEGGPQDLLFTVLVTNLSNRPFDIQAQDFSLGGDALAREISAEDPEARIRNLQPLDCESATGLDAFSAVFRLWETIDSVKGDETREQAANREKSRKEEDEARADRVRSCRRYDAERRRERVAVEETFLRRTTLRPAGQANGKIRFLGPYHEGNAFLQVALGDESVVVPFSIKRAAE